MYRLFDNRFALTVEKFMKKNFVTSYTTEPSIYCANKKSGKKSLKQSNQYK